MPVFENIFSEIFGLIKASWWIILPIFLFLLWKELWLNYVRKNYIKNISWKFLEVKIPQDIIKSPKAMEQVFASIHAIATGKIKFLNKWLKGKVENWLSFELAGQAGNVRFYIKMPEEFRNLVESTIYSQYPEVEITEAEDYTEILPSVLSSKIYELYVSEFILAKENPYPILTYLYFEEREEERKVDPLATISETISKLGNEEMIWLQFLIKPIDENWRKKGEEIVAKLAGKKITKEKTLLEELASFLRDLVKAPFTPPVYETEKDEGPASKMSSLTPGEKGIIEAIEKKISKSVFETTIRFIYIDLKDEFTKKNVSAVQGAFRQYSTSNLNFFKEIKRPVKLLMKKYKSEIQKHSFFASYRNRALSKKPSVLNTEELASIYHYPTVIIKAPLLREKRARRGEPPVGLPII